MNHPSNNQTDTNQYNILKISDIPSKYPQQWVTVDITQRDKYGWPFEGKVVLHSKNKEKIVDKIKNIDGDLYFFYTGSIDDEVA
jgi:hypothetical protein